jgi:hypothetical protein
MGYCYFDETIRQNAGFIVGAWVYSNSYLTPDVFSALNEAGLQPGVDEFKSGARMTHNPAQAKARSLFFGILSQVRVGTVVMPSDDRASLGAEALIGLAMFLTANGLNGVAHSVFIDGGIPVAQTLIDGFCAQIGSPYDVRVQQESKLLGGIQIADLVAHTMGIMLLERQGHLKKVVKASPGSGYHPNEEFQLGFELWSSLRCSLFKAEMPIPRGEDLLGNLEYLVEGYGLHISRSSGETLRASAIDRFGRCYMGCIH